MPRWVGHQPPWGRWRARSEYGFLGRWLLWPLLALWRRLWYTEKPPFPRPNFADYETMEPEWKELDSNWR